MTDTERFDTSLDRWLAGDADPGDEAELEAAAAADPRFAAELERVRRLRAEIAALPAEIEPRPELWHAIAARTRPRAPLHWPLALAAAVLLALLLPVVAGRFPSSSRPHADVAELPQPSPIALTAYAATDRELTAIRVELERAIEARRSDLPPATREIVFRNLDTIERCIAEIEAAMADAPTDRELARTYISYRERQIDLLRRANVLASRL